MRSPFKKGNKEDMYNEIESELLEPELENEYGHDNEEEYYEEGNDDINDEELGDFEDFINLEDFSTDTSYVSDIEEVEYSENDSVDDAEQNTDACEDDNEFEFVLDEMEDNTEDIREKEKVFAPLNNTIIPAQKTSKREETERDEKETKLCRNTESVYENCKNELQAAMRKTKDMIANMGIEELLDLIEHRYANDDAEEERGYICTIAKNEIIKRYRKL